MKPSRYIFWIILLAAALRIYGLGSESLWLDEGATVVRHSLSLSELRVDAGDGSQAPLYFIISKFWCSIFGASEFSLRFPAFLFGLLCVLAIYHLGRRLIDPGVGAWAALLLAINPYAIYYSQEARPYTLLLLGAIISSYYLIHLLKQVTIKDAVGYVIATLVVLYTHAFGALLLLTHVLGWAIYRTVPGYRAARRSVRPLLITFGITLLLFLPQFYTFLRQFPLKLDGTHASNWIPVPDLLDLFRPLVDFFMDPKLAVAALVIAGLTAVFRFLTNQQARPALLFAASVWISFTLIPWIISIALTPIFFHRYTIPALAVVILVLAWAISGLETLPKRIVAGLLILLSILPIYHQLTKIDKDPWRQTATLIREDLRGGDVVVLDPGCTWKAFDYYFTPPGGIRVLRVSDETDFEHELERAQRLWVVRSYSSIPETNRPLADHLTESWQLNRDPKLFESLVLNPYALWVSEIDVKLYTPATLEPQPLTGDP